MPRITYVEPGGRSVTLQLQNGQTLMRAAMDADLEGIEAQCGGNCSCATCHCYVQPDWLDRLKAPSEDERLMLENVAAERRPNSRLSCQLVAEERLDGMTVQFPDRQS
jgi:2Fe-2S ferredoxin